MDYLAFVSDIEKIWSESSNSKICKEYSLNRSVLPALIKLHREWKKVYDLEVSNYDELELELNHFKSNQNLVKTVELEKKISELRKVVDELQQENYELEKKVHKLSDCNFNLENKSILQKLLG